eukprot:4598563-Pyramimonas_sp.AAC.1
MASHICQYTAHYNILHVRGRLRRERARKRAWKRDYLGEPVSSHAFVTLAVSRGLRGRCLTNSLSLVAPAVYVASVAPAAPLCPTGSLSPFGIALGALRF